MDGRHGVSFSSSSRGRPSCSAPHPRTPSPRQNPQPQPPPPPGPQMREANAQGAAAAAAAAFLPGVCPRRGGPAGRAGGRINTPPRPLSDRAQECEAGGRDPARRRRRRHRSRTSGEARPRRRDGLVVRPVCGPGGGRGPDQGGGEGNEPVGASPARKKPPPPPPAPPPPSSLLPQFPPSRRLCPGSGGGGRTGGGGGGRRPAGVGHGREGRGSGKRAARLCRLGGSATAPGARRLGQFGSRARRLGVGSFLGASVPESTCSGQMRRRGERSWGVRERGYVCPSARWWWREQGLLQSRALISWGSPNYFADP